MMLYEAIDIVRKIILSWLDFRYETARRTTAVTVNRRVSLRRSGSSTAMGFNRKNEGGGEIQILEVEALTGKELEGTCLVLLTRHEEVNNTI